MILNYLQEQNSPNILHFRHPKIYMNNYKAKNWDLL